MEAFAGDAAWEFDLLGLKTSYNKEKNTFTSSSSSDLSGSTVRHVVDKKVPSLDVRTGKAVPGQHDVFTGIIDGVTGEIIHGTRTYTLTGEVYEGPFAMGGRRHGDGAIVQNFSFQLPKPSFFATEQEDEEDTDDNDFMTRQQLPPSLSLTYNRSNFFGSYRNDQPFHGTLVTNTFTFVGSFQNRMFGGTNGELIHADGSKYKGDFKHGAFDGFGHERDRTGEYQGEFKKGFRHGQGIFQSLPNPSEENDDNNHDNDNGTWSKTEGYYYQGEYRRGMKHGQGTERTPEGDEYKGTFQLDHRHGSGRLRNRDSGIIYEGSWYHGQPVNEQGNEWRIRYPNGDQYVGGTKDYLPHGHGFYRYANGDHWAGEFRDGRVYNTPESLLLSKSNKSKESSLGNDKNNNENNNNNKSPNLQRQMALDAIANSLSTSLEMMHDNSRISMEYESNHSETRFDQRCRETLLESMEVLLRMHGATTLRDFDNGDIFLGTWDERTRRNGYGIFFSRTTGSSYFGHFLDDKRHGFGVLLHPELGTYIGEFRNNKKVGLGTLMLANASYYNGHFIGGAFHGKGTMNDSNGITYVGEWSDGVRAGVGVETNHVNGTIYSGTFKDDKRHGNGVLMDNKDDRVIYTGEWMDGLYHGQGIWVNRRVVSTRKQQQQHVCTVSRFEGGFAKGQRHGFGTFINGDGYVGKGTWSKGQPVPGNWRINFPDGSIYSGQAHVNEDVSKGRITDDILALLIPNGFGTYKYKNGDVYCGNFVTGERSGAGTCVFIDGSKWEGEWHHDHMNQSGGGVFTTTDGQIQEFPIHDEAAA